MTNLPSPMSDAERNYEANAELQAQVEDNRAHPERLRPRRAVGVAQQVFMTSAEKFWYICGCIMAGAFYFAKIPAKKAFVEAGLKDELTTWEAFWYVLMCIAFGAGYFAKVPVKKALSELSVV